MAEKRHFKITVKTMVTVSMNIALLAVSSWITIPFPINFTLQTLAIFIICGTFKLSVSVMSVALYLLLGFIGVPVFSAFGSGISALVGPTGGYLLGFLTVPFTVNAFRFRNKGHILRIMSMLFALILLYIIGTLWYWLVYTASEITFFQAFCLCTAPFIVPDVLKAVLAEIISSRLSVLNF